MFRMGKLLFLVLAVSISVPSFSCENENDQQMGVVLDLVGDNFYYQKDGLCSRLMSYSKKLYGDVNLEEVLAIHAYTENGYYKGINRTLRSGKAADKEKYGPFIQVMKNGLGKLPNYKGQVTRFTTWSKGSIKRLKIGAIRSLKAFTSSSKKKGFTWNGKTKLIIQSTKGKFIGMMSQYPSEEEVLFMPNSKFKVTKVVPAKSEGQKDVVYMTQQ